MSLAFPKAEYVRNKLHQKFVRELCCIRCHTHPCDPAHYRLQTGGGGALKPSDIFLLPICHGCHLIQHQHGEKTFYRDMFPDAEDQVIIDYVKDFCKRLYAVTGDKVRGFQLAMGFRNVVL